MSDQLTVSRSVEGDTLEVRLGAAVIVIGELRIRPMSNWKTPHQVLGRGGASIALTDQQFAELVGEYMRLTFLGAVDVKQGSCVGKWRFECSRVDENAGAKI